AEWISPWDRVQGRNHQACNERQVAALAWCGGECWLRHIRAAAQLPSAPDLRPTRSVRAIGADSELSCTECRTPHAINVRPRSWRVCRTDRTQRCGKSHRATTAGWHYTSDTRTCEHRRQGGLADQSRGWIPSGADRSREHLSQWCNPGFVATRGESPFRSDR